MKSLINFYNRNPLNKHILISVGIFITTLLFKLIFFTDYGLWYDEAFSVFHSQGSFHEIEMVSRWDFNPPLYNYILHVWTKLFGISELSVRILSLIFISLATSIVYIFTLKFFNKDTAIFSAILFFSSDVFFFYSQEARVYSLLFLLYILSSWIFFELLKKPNIYKAILLGAINWLIIFSHYSEGIIILFQGIVMLIIFKKKQFSFFILSCITSILFIHKWIPRMIDIFFSGGNRIVPNPSLSMIKNVFLQLFNDNMFLFITFIVIIVIGSIFQIINKKENKEKLNYILYFLLIGILSHFIFYVISFNAPMYGKRYMLFTLPPIYISIAYLMSVIKIISWIKYSIMGGVFLISMLSINYDIDKNMDYKNAMPLIKENKNDSTLVLVQSISMKSLFTYYYDQCILKNKKEVIEKLNDENIYFVNDTSGINNITISDYKNIIFAQTWERFADPKKTLKKYLDNNFVFQEEINDFDDIKLSFYENTNYNKVSYINKKRKEINKIILSIRANNVWLESVKQKAVKNGISLDSMLIIDANWVYENR